MFSYVLAQAVIITSLPEPKESPHRSFTISKKAIGMILPLKHDPSGLVFSPYNTRSKSMTPNDNARRQQLHAGLKASIITAAVVGAVGGWVAFSPQPPATDMTSAAVPAANTTSAVAAVPASGTTAQNADTSSAQAPATSNAPATRGTTRTRAQRAPAATTRSSK